MVQWLGLLASTAVGLIPGWGTKILQVVQHSQKKKVEMTQPDGRDQTKLKKLPRNPASLLLANEPSRNDTYALLFIHQSTLITAIS